VKRGLALLGLAVAYLLAARLGLTLAFVNASVTAVWPPTGIAFAAVLVLGYGVWPAVFAGAFAANLATAGGVATSLAIAAGNTLEALLGAWLVNRFAGGRRVFEDARNIFRFVLLAALASTSVSASVGVSALAAGGLAPSQGVGALWLTWWLGDATGDLLVAPALVHLWNAPAPRFDWRWLAETLSMLAAAAGVAALVFGGLLPAPFAEYPLAFLCIPLVLWAAFRKGPRATSILTLSLAVVSVWGTLRGTGPFARVSENESLLLLQTFTSIVAILGLTVAAVVAERKLAEERAQRLNQELERRVEERTAELQRSEERLLEAQEIARIGSWEWDIPTNRLWWSRELHRIFGTDPATFEASYEGYLQRLPAEDRERAHAIVQSAFQDKQPFGFEHRVVRPDGSVRHVYGHGRVITDAGGSPVSMRGTAQDITDRKKVEEKFKGLLEAAPDAIVIVDATGRILLVNAQTEKLFGYAREQLIGQPVEILTPERFRGEHARYRSGFFAEPKVRAMGSGLDLYGRRSDGSEFPVEISLSPLQTEEGVLVSSAIRDITERKHAEEALRASEERTRLILETSYSAFVAIDGSGRIAEWNAAAHTMFGWSRDEALGRVLADTIVPPRYRAAHLAGLERYRNTGIASVLDKSLELTGLRRSGEEFPLELTISVSRLNGSPIFHAFLRDITERKAAEDALRRSRAELDRHARELERSNAELERFAYVASHDLQEPLRMVASYTGLLERRYKDKLDAAGREFIHFAVDGATRMQKLIQDLLLLSRVGTRGEPFGRVDSDAVLRQALRDLRRRIGETKGGVTHGPLPAVWGDATQIGQLFLNLIGNALKFHGADPPRVEVRAERKGELWEFSVADNGIGVAPEHQQRIFVVFQRLHTRDEYPGTGIGLAICKKIVERHGGSIWVDARPGPGSTFRFTLPGAAESAAAEAR
jgi:PAS domain S-box-containing protein